MKADSSTCRIKIYLSERCTLSGVLCSGNQMYDVVHLCVLFTQRATDIVVEAVPPTMLVNLQSPPALL